MNSVHFQSSTKFWQVANCTSKHRNPAKPTNKNMSNNNNEPANAAAVTSAVALEDEDEVTVISTAASADAPATSSKLKGFKAIAAKMKEYEVKASVTERLDPTKPFLLRLDGHCFSTFTQPFNKPFDLGLNEIIIRTAKDMLVEYNFATTAYTCSDEITLVFPRLIVDPADKNADKQALLFSGRILKLSSLGKLTIAYSHHATHNPSLTC